jgi:hypothetical protein
VTRFGEFSPIKERRYDFKNIFAKKIAEKIGVFDPKQR